VLGGAFGQSNCFCLCEVCRRGILDQDSIAVDFRHLGLWQEVVSARHLQPDGHKAVLVLGGDSSRREQFLQRNCDLVQSIHDGIVFSLQFCLAPMPTNFFGGILLGGAQCHLHV